MTPLLIAADNAQVFYTIRDFFNTFFETLIPISICVVLPIIVISMVMRARRHEVDKKTEVMLKAVESGAQLDPAFFQEINTRKEKTVKDRLMGYLTTACITTSIGVLMAVVSTLFLILKDSYKPAALLVLLIPCAIMIGIGVAFFIVYAVGKKTWASELAELDAKKNTDRQ
ncbi:MAG: hypothetical protein J6X24_07175 [Firmicutes bacterium]|nr:hypothetical protein [Bacillota bacterium]